MAQQNIPDNEHRAASPNGEEHFRLLSDLTSAFVYVNRLETDGRLVPEWVGGAATQVTGYTAGEIMLSGLEPLIVPDDRPVFRRQIERALAGEADSTEARIVTKDGQTRWLRFYARPVTADANAPRLYGAAQDVTEQKRAHEELIRRERDLTDFIENAAVGIHWVAGDGTIIWANQAELDLLGYTREEYIGHHIAEFHADEETIGDMLRRLSNKETLHSYEARLRCKDGSIRHVLISSNVRWDGERFIHTRCFTRDITERKLAEQAHRESEQRYRIMADIGIALTTNQTLKEMLRDCAAAIVDHLGAAFARIWTLNEEENVLELQASAGMYRHLDGAHSRIAVGEYKIGLIAAERKPHLTNQVVGDPRVSDQEWARREGMVSFAGYPLIIEGSLVGVMAMFARHRLSEETLGLLASVASEVALGIERLKVDEQLREQTEMLETINRIGAVLSAELDQERLVQTVTDAATHLTGAQFGSFFYNVYTDEGGAFMLYTLSGAPREAFAHFPMPRATDLFGPTFRGEGTLLIKDVKKDPRYGNNSPYHGMPPGHLPVTSYLAVPVISRSGEVIGGLFFGHSEAGIFSEKDARIVEGLAAQTAIAMDNARLYQKTQQALVEREELLSREQKARAQAEEASRAKDEFLGMLSHELRTPLNAIVGWIRMLQRGRLEDELFTRALETIDRNAKLQARLIEDMLDLSRITSGKLRLDVQPTDLTIVINAAVDTLRPAADAKHIRLQVVMDFGAGLILGDSARLQQVIWNLLSNAIKFTPKEGRVQVQLERINSHVEIIVSDTGPGIPEDFMPYVFDRFRQADSSSTRAHGGLGLGLAIVRHLVELHGGTVEAGNRADRQGAVFTVRFPIMVVRRQTGDLAAGAARVHPTGGATIPFDCPPALDGLKVLAVDDEVDARQLLQAVLEQCGAEVRTCGSAQEALRALTEFKPDLLVSDIGMPDIDGYSLMEQIRALPPDEGGRVPAVALTAYARVEDRLAALSVGYNMHVPKPVEPAELALVIASLTGRNKKQEPRKPDATAQ
ncbi:MAG TPA: GAF domain-containing protein [Blastocatellia bacterium]|nr:GAF domain-containing protein [Blastocatellia bacterium]